MLVLCLPRTCLLHGSQFDLLLPCPLDMHSYPFIPPLIYLCPLTLVVYHLLVGHLYTHTPLHPHTLPARLFWTSPVPDCPYPSCCYYPLPTWDVLTLQDYWYIGSPTTTGFNPLCPVACFFISFATCPHPGPLTQDGSPSPLFPTLPPHVGLHPICNTLQQHAYPFYLWFGSCALPLPLPFVVDLHLL